MAQNLGFTLFRFSKSGFTLKIRMARHNVVQLMLLLFVEAAVLAFMITYTVRALSSKKTATYRDMLFLVLVVVALKDLLVCGVTRCEFGLGINFMLVLVLWAVASGCDRDLDGLLVLTSVFLGIEFISHVVSLLGNARRSRTGK